MRGWPAPGVSASTWLPQAMARWRPSPAAERQVTSSGRPSIRSINAPSGDRRNTASLQAAAIKGPAGSAARAITGAPSASPKLVCVPSAAIWNRAPVSAPARNPPRGCAMRQGAVRESAAVVISGGGGARRAWMVARPVSPPIRRRVSGGSGSAKGASDRAPSARAMAMIAPSAPLAKACATAGRRQLRARASNRPWLGDVA